MDRIIRIEPRHPYRLYVEFEDGVRGEVDMSQRLNGAVFEALRDPVFFAQVRIDELGAPVWPNGTDIAPDALHDRLAAVGKSAGAE